MLSSISSSQSYLQASFVAQSSLAETNQQSATKDKQKEGGIVSSNSKSRQDSTQQQSLQDLKQIQQLKSRDQEVKAHEQAHLSAAGSLATGGASFTYQTGPNGVRYAIGGEVNIDTSAVDGDPAATLRKADTIRRAALAPAEPSSQDQMVAAKAAAMSAKASIELVKLDQQQIKGSASVKNKDDNKLNKNLLDKANTNTEPLITLGSLLDILA